MKKFNSFIVVLLSIISSFYAQNTLSLIDNSGTTNETITVSLEITNSDNFVAFQTDITLPSQVSYVNGSAQLTSRANGHGLSANIVDGNKLRLIAYSYPLANFTGNSGSVATFDLKLSTIPGTYTLSLSNAIISDENSQNILTGTNNGDITIYGPEISLSTTSIDFGEVPLLQTRDRSFTITNNGNQNLEITNIANSVADFEVIGGNVFTITPGGNRSVTIRFNSVTKGTYNNVITVSSNDPDEATSTINSTVVAFAINELHGQTASGRSGYPIEVSFTMNNMDDIVGLQFDMNLPSALTLVADSAKLSSRKQDHVISAQYIGSNKIRVIAYSGTNTAFTEDDGEILTLQFMLDGTGGNHSYSLENVILTDINAENVTSDFSSSYVNIASPDINGNSSINFGEVSVVDSAIVSYQINNTGNDTLTITSISSNSSKFWIESELPLVILQGESENINVFIYNETEGGITGRLTVRSNDPDEDPFYINLSATSFEPNYIIAKDITCFQNEEVELSINVDNHQEFTAFQLDIDLPNNFNYIDGSAKLTSRKQDHSLSISNISGNKYRLIAFSMTGKSFLLDTGAVATITCTANSDPGSYSAVLSDCILSDNSSNNILKSAQNGSIDIDASTVVNTKVFLEGAYNDNNMRADLASIPLTQPYNTSPWNYNGTESVDEIPAYVVDWVLVELRSNATTHSMYRAGFLLTTGEIVDLDGTSNLKFPITGGNYFFVVYHRNHLPVMTSNSISLTPSSSLYDFTDNANKAYGTQAMKDLGDGYCVMYSGDANGNGQVQNNDNLDYWKIQNGQSGYKAGDFNLNGQVQNNDYQDYYRTNNGVGSQVPSSNEQVNYKHNINRGIR